LTAREPLRDELQIVWILGPAAPQDGRAFAEGKSEERVRLLDDPKLLRGRDHRICEV